MSKVIDSQLHVYQDNFNKHGDSPEGTHNQNLVLQHTRFERLVKQFASKDNRYSLHDIGCGICDLYEYLKDNDYQFDYSGTDVVPEMRDLANEKYPEIKFKVRDILEQDTSGEQYDFVVLVGTFNMPGECPRDVWTDFTNNMIKKMFSMARYGISFSFLTQHADFYHPEMHYRDPSECMDFCVKNLSRHVVLDHSYPLYDFTTTVFTDKYLREKYNNSKLTRYLEDNNKQA